MKEYAFNRTGSMRLRMLTCGAALLGLLSAASPALASTARVISVGVEYTADSGETNNVTITKSEVVPPPETLGEMLFGRSVAIDFADGGPGVTITPEWPSLHVWGCEENSLRPGVVWCPVNGLVWADLGDQNDSFSMEFPVRVAVQGGAGDDNLSGGPRADQLLGEDGSDTLDGRGDNDYLVGFAGNDTLVGGTGADNLLGGPDKDVVTYKARNASVTVSVGDNIGDGEAGEGDIVASDVEDVIGGSANDTLIGSSAGNGLTGGPGFDDLRGGPGDDLIYAQDGGPDWIDCGSGYDVAYVDYLGDASIGGSPGVVSLNPVIDAVTDCEEIHY